MVLLVHSGLFGDYILVIYNLVLLLCYFFKPYKFIEEFHLRAFKSYLLFQTFLYTYLSFFHLLCINLILL